MTFYFSIGAIWQSISLRSKGLRGRPALLMGAPSPVPGLWWTPLTNHKSPGSFKNAWGWRERTSSSWDFCSSVRFGPILSWGLTASHCSSSGKRRRGIASIVCTSAAWLTCPSAAPASTSSGLRVSCAWSVKTSSRADACKGKDAKCESGTGTPLDASSVISRCARRLFSGFC
jgi:hypothetical protein